MSNGSPTRPRYQGVRSGLLREMLLDSARDELSDKTWAKTTLASIAAGGGVHRSSVYRVFNSRAELGRALVARECQRLADTIERTVLDSAGSPGVTLSEALEVYLHALADSPLVGSLADREGASELLAFLAPDRELAGQREVRRLAAIIARRWPQLDSTHATLLAEGMVRIAVTYTNGPTSTENGAAASLAALFGAFVEHAIGRHRT